MEQHRQRPVRAARSLRTTEGPSVLDLRQAGLPKGGRSFATAEPQPMITVTPTNGKPQQVQAPEASKPCLSADKPAMEVADYNRCVDEYSDALFRFVLKHLRDRDEAKDIVQDAFLRLWMKLDQVRPGHARGYLFTTAHHLIVDRSRRRKYVARYDDWHADVLTTRQPKAGVKDVIDRALATLTPVQRSLVLLRDLEGHTYQDIAAITGLDMTKVKVYLFRARKAMQAFIGDPELVV